MSKLREFLIGKHVVVDHPKTCLNPTGKEGFKIIDVSIDGDRIFVRGQETCWFGERSILEIR